MKVKISASYSGKLPVASFSNVNPGFFAEVETDLDETLEYRDLSKYVEEVQKDLHGICLKNFQVVAEQAKVEKLKNDLKGFRFYATDSGQYPSVTTILDPDFKAWISDDELKVAIAEGNINHARAARFIATGEWVEPKMLEGVGADLLLCKGRVIDSWDFPAMVEKYKIGMLENGRTLYNHAHKYAGTNDAECLYPLGGEKDGDLVPTIIDFKRTPDKDKNFSQMAAYAKCEGMEHIKQMMVIHTNSDTAQGFSKPILSTAIDKYFDVFLAKRKTFLETYGI